MNKPQTYDLIITFTDGSHQRFKFPSQVEPLKMSHFIERLLTAPTLSLQMTDSLMVLPTGSIRSAEIVPLPEKLPEVVLHDVVRVSEAS